MMLKSLNCIAIDKEQKVAFEKMLDWIWFEGSNGGNNINTFAS